MDYLDRKMKAQMKSADRLDAKYIIVLGETELEEQVATVKTYGNWRPTKSRIC